MAGIERRLLVLPGGRTSDAAVTGPADDLEELVDGMRRRSPWHTAAAFERFAPVARRVLVRMLGSHDVEDLVQEVFLHLFRRLGSLRSPQAFPAFVLTFAANTAKWELRRRAVRRIMRLSSNGEAPDVAFYEPDPEAREALRAFYGILDDLSAADRAAYVLRYLEQMEVTDVAKALAVSRSTAKRRFTRAWQYVRERVEAHPLLVEYARAQERGGESHD